MDEVVDSAVCGERNQADTCGVQRAGGRGLCSEATHQASGSCCACRSRMSEQALLKERITLREEISICHIQFREKRCLSQRRFSVNLCGLGPLTIAWVLPGRNLFSKVSTLSRSIC